MRMMSAKFGVLLCLLAVCLVGCSNHDEPILDGSGTWPADAGNVVNGVIPEVNEMDNYGAVKKRQYSYQGYKATLGYLDEKSAKLTISSDVFDLSSVKGNPISGKISVPGIIPDSRSVSLTVNWVEYSSMFDQTQAIYMPIERDADYAGKKLYYKKLYFEGKGDTELISYKCVGMMDGINKEIWFNIVDVDFKTGSGHDGMWITDEFQRDAVTGSILESPFLIEWETSFVSAEMKRQLSPSAFLQLILNAPFIPANSFGLSGHDVRLISFNQLFKVINPIIGFSGDEIIMYSIYSWSGNDSSDVRTERSFPVNTVTYLPRGDDGKMSVYVNAGGLYDINVCEYRAPGNPPCYYPMNTPDLYGLFSKILLSLSPDMTNGFSMEIFTSDRSMRWSIINSEVCIELIRSTILPLLQNEVYRSRLLRSVKENDEISGLYDIIKKYVESFESMLDSTVGMKLGLNATKISEKDQEYLYEIWEKYHYRIPD